VSLTLPVRASATIDIVFVETVMVPSSDHKCQAFVADVLGEANAGKRRRVPFRLPSSLWRMILSELVRRCTFVADRAVVPWNSASPVVS